MCNIPSPGKDIRLLDPDSRVLHYRMNVLSSFLDLFHGFRIARHSPVSVEMENLAHIRLPA